MWQRLPGAAKREQLAALTGIPAPNLSGLNTGRLSMTLQLATRIAEAVEGVSVLDLGEPTGSADALSLTIEDRLEAIEAQLDRQGKATTRGLKGLEAQLQAIRDLLEPRAPKATAGQ